MKGHEDDKDDVEVEDLPIEAQLNIESDRLAELGYHLAASPQEHLPGTKISVYLDGQYISDSNMRRNINHKEHSQPLQDYIKQKYEWEDEIMTQIDWDLCQETLDKRPIHQSTNIIKYIYG